MRNKNLYQIMGLNPSNCTTSQIKNRYRQLVKLYHPDRHGNEQKMIEINQAYETLVDPMKRLKYDQTLIINPKLQKNQPNQQKPKTNSSIDYSIKFNQINLLSKIKVGLSLTCLLLISLIGLQLIKLNNQIIVDQYPINSINNSYNSINPNSQKLIDNVQLIQPTKPPSNQSNIQFIPTPNTKKQCQDQKFLNSINFFQTFFNHKC